MFSSILKQKAKQLPRSPGCYLFRDINNIVIYVGKAKSLKSRVGSYFQEGLDTSSKTHALVQRINDIEYIEAASEFEALILEAELIKKYDPKYNIVLKDDKSYLYIVIRNEKTINGNFPVVLTARKSDLKKGDNHFGPFPSSTTAKYVLKTLRRIFPYRDCSPAKFTKYHKLNRTCLFGDIGLCLGPCVNTSPNTLTEYKNNITRIDKLLSGESVKVINDLKTQMRKHAIKKEYETATRYRDLIKKFEYVRQNFYSPQQYIENPYLVEDLAQKALEDLQENLPVLKKLPQRIECYDISNISGKEAVGSMVVAIGGKIEKGEYKRFKIKFKHSPDDFEMMSEVLSRRLKRESIKPVKLVGKTAKEPIKKPVKKWDTPDLIVLDGGKGQVSAVLDVCKNLGIDIPVVGLAKKFETLVFKKVATKNSMVKNGKSEEFIELRLDKDSPGLKLLIQLRDESHRFAQKYHHFLRLKNLKSDI